MVTISSRAKGAANKSAHQAAAARLIEFFYSVHYEIGTALEDVVRGDRLSRQQAATLWLIHAQGDLEGSMRRKDIEANLRRWFEVTSAAVTKSLRSMMRPPLGLIAITEDPRSGREKLVTLTPKGRTFLDESVARATSLLAELIEDVPATIRANAIIYFTHLTGAFSDLQRRDRLRLVRPGGETKKANKTKTR